MNVALIVRVLAWSFALLLLALPLIGVLNGSFASERWPLRQLELHAELRNVTQEQIQTVVGRHSGKGFFALSLTGLRDELAQLPWVESVEVRKRWPDTVLVRLLEYQPYAIWADRAVVSRSGHLFTVPGIDTLGGLARLWGPDEQVVEVVNFHARAVAALESTRLDVVETRLLSRGSWHLVLDGGAEIALGRDNAEARLQRFAATIQPLLRSHAQTPLRRADLRYPNGYALVWAQPTESAPNGTTEATATSPIASPAVDESAVAHVQEPQA